MNESTVRRLEHPILAASAFASILLLAGGITMPGSSSSSGDAKTIQTAAPQQTAPKGPPPGMNANGEVVDSSKVESG